MSSNSRRQFLRQSALTAGLAGISSLPVFANNDYQPSDDRPNVIGPREGFSPQVGTMLSMMTWMRGAVLSSVQKMTMEQLDYLHDDKSNTIGSMLFHLAATERFYQLHTFEGRKWGEWPTADADRFGIAMELGEEARKAIKGHDLKFYLDTLSEVRDNTIAEFKKHDDQWLMTVDEKWYWGPTNNYCKWFHVCEHESNHNGQIKWIRGRLKK